MTLDAWRLAVGTLTAWPVRAPRRVTHRVAGRAMLVAPLAVVPLGVAVAAVLLVGREAGVAGPAVAALAVGVLALGSRALHLDGLSDVADGLTVSYDRQRSLEVMKSGTAGPAGVAALVVVLGVQGGALAGLAAEDAGPVVAGVLVCSSRAALVLCCAHGVRPARSTGLAVAHAQTVPRVIAAMVWVVLAVVVTLTLGWSGWPWWRGAVVAAAGLLAAVVLLRRCVTRFGGVTGDVFGATIEVTLAAMLLAAT